MTNEESDALHKFAADKLGVEIREGGFYTDKIIGEEITLWFLDDGPFRPFRPLTSWDLMGQGMDVAKEHWNITIFTDDVIMENSPRTVGNTTGFDSYLETPTAFWQCYMKIEGKV